MYGAWYLAHYTESDPELGPSLPQLTLLHIPNCKIIIESTASLSLQMVWEPSSSLLHLFFSPKFFFSFNHKIYKLKKMILQILLHYWILQNKTMSFIIHTHTIKHSFIILFKCHQHILTTLIYKFFIIKLVVHLAFYLNKSVRFEHMKQKC